MRKIILSCLLLGISLTTYAQTSLFDLWQEASEHVNIYTYGLKPVKKEPCFRPDWKQKRGTKLEISSPTIGLLKKMLEDIESEGFQFNPQNDTLLFHVYFCSWWAPCDLVVKTSAGISHYYQPPKEESFKIDSVMLAEDFFISSILYYGDNSAFTDFFRRYVILLPDSDGRYTLVFRIILKDGKIMTPSEVWKIADVYMWEGNYLTEEDIIFLKKLSHYYNKSDLNRLENFFAHNIIAVNCSLIFRKGISILFFRHRPQSLTSLRSYRIRLLHPIEGGGNRGNPFLEIQEHRHHKSKK